MPLFVLGINHQTAPVEIRERVAFAPRDIIPALEALTGLEGVDEALIVSTCNRTEIYCAGNDHGQAIGWLHDRLELNERDHNFTYLKQQNDSVQHCFAVAAGLDSMILGEPQILGQMKDAYRAAHAGSFTGPQLNRLFQQVFRVAKRIRTETAIGRSAVSAASAAVALARQIFAGFERHTALLIGAGEIIDLTAKHLKTQNLGRMIIANRSLHRARRIAVEHKGFAIGLDEVDTHLPEADLVISCTASPNHVVTSAAVKTALDKRRRKPMFIVDLAVPRDVEPATAEFEDVYLYTVDDLRNAIEANIDARKEAALEAHNIIHDEVASFESTLSTLGAVPVIRGIRDAAARIRDETVDQARRMLDNGRPAEEVLEFLGSTLTNRLLHRPSSQLRQAGEDGDAHLMEAATRLFGDDTSRK
ncbi:MAG: glutamyl-tRNA reductase [Pseudomonadota bacterium]